MALLTTADQQRIDSVIQDVALRTGVSYPINNLLEIANAANIRVMEGDLSSFGTNISGLIDYDDYEAKSNPVIYINSRISKQRKQFTLGHELGHHFLHTGMKYRVDTLDYSRDDQDVFEESEANYFAASLLVPKDYLLDEVKSGSSVQQLAEYFGVSIPVIQNRLRWLKIQ